MMKNFMKTITKESVWSLYRIEFVDVDLSNYVQQGGHKYHPLPKWIANRKAIINPQNDNEFCFMYAATLANNLEYFSSVSHPEKITKRLKDMTQELNWSGIDFSQKVWKPEFLKFEKNNPGHKLIVYTIDPDKEKFITKCFQSKPQSVQEERMVLTLFFDSENGHFSVIKNKSKLLSKQMTGKYRGKCHFCIGCDNVFKSEEAKNNHENACFERKTKKYPLRDKDTGEVKKMRFKNVGKMSKCPFVAYADCEDFLRPM